MIKKYSDVAQNIEKRVENPVIRGKQTGFQALDAIYTVATGSFTCIHGAPHQGKSEVIFEILVNLSMKYGDINVIYSPESGDAEQIYIELAHKYLQKQIVRYHPLYEVATDRDRVNALEWVGHHFYVLDGDEDDGYSFDRICNDVAELEKKEGLKVSNIMAEPHNEIIHDEMKDLRQDLYIEFFLTKVRRYARKTKKHCFLSFHVGKQEKQKIGNMLYYGMPKAREASGGQAALRKAMCWLNIWRPKKGLKDDSGNLYEPNQLVIDVEKARPKYVAYLGHCSLYYSFSKQRYYEKINGIDCYAFEHETKREELEQAAQVISQTEMAFTPPTEDISYDKLPF